jgi:hypothetical protein
MPSLFLNPFSKCFCKHGNSTPSLHLEGCNHRLPNPHTSIDEPIVHLSRLETSEARE